MSEKVRKLKTRCYYTDYVNHAIRFYLTCPDVLNMNGKRKADILNWISVQAVFSSMKEDEKQVLIDVYNAHYRLPEGVRIYCQRNNIEDDHDLWVLITKVSSAIAKRRGLV